jgi:hypothetical protein
MGDEMFYRYQESMIDNATTTLALLLQHSADDANLPGVGTGELTAARH